MIFFLMVVMKCKDHDIWRLFVKKQKMVADFSKVPFYAIFGQKNIALEEFLGFWPKDYHKFLNHEIRGFPVWIQNMWW